MYLVHLAITVLDSDMNTIIIVVVVHTLTYRYNTVRGHRTGSNNSERKITSEGYLRRKTNKNRR